MTNIIGILIFVISYVIYVSLDCKSCLFTIIWWRVCWMTVIEKLVFIRVVKTNKKVSSLIYYSYSLMIRENEDNHILKCRWLFYQHAVEMYVKIEAERLTFIRLNHTKLRSEYYIHLWDSINTDWNANNVGRKITLPATYIVILPHMYEYAQESMTYVRHYGIADLSYPILSEPANKQHT